MTPFRIYEHQVEENGLVTVLLPKFENKVLKTLFLSKNKSPFIHIKLDEFGSETWLNLDGKNSVEKVATILIDKFGDRIQPVHERLTKFITQLYLQKFITFNEIKK